MIGEYRVTVHFKDGRVKDVLRIASDEREAAKLALGTIASDYPKLAGAVESFEAQHHPIGWHNQAQSV